MNIVVLVSEIRPTGTDVYIQFRVLTMDGKEASHSVLFSALGASPLAMNTALLTQARAFATARWAIAPGNDYLVGGVTLGVQL
jgi:hypothetical protein